MLLLLGSGVSRPSGLPGVVELTHELLNGEYHRDAKRHGRFFAEPPDGSEILSLSDLQRFLRVLLDLDAHYLQSIAPFKSGQSYGRTGAVFRKTTSYEDLAYLCQRIITSGSGLLDDAQAGAFAELVEQKSGDLLGSGPVEARLIELYVLASEAFRFAQWLIANLLQSEHAVGLDLLVALASTDALGATDIFTLNHDTLVETALGVGGIDFADGFGKRDGDVRWYDDSVYDANGVEVRLFKLHGSVNWHSLAGDRGSRTAIVLHGIDPQLAVNGVGKRLDSRLASPILLSGVDKAMAYNRGIYADLMYRLHRALRDTDVILVSGYGWGDTGINFRLDDWLDRDPGNRMVLLHEKPEDLSDRSLQFSTSFKQRLKTKQLVVIPKWLCNVSYAEVEEAVVGRR